MRVATFTRASEIPEALWDAAAPDDFFFRRSFLRAMEESGVEDARYRFLVLLGEESEAVAVGLAVLSTFTLKLDLLTDDLRVRQLRRLTGGMLDVRIICCGIPASCGQHHLHVVRENATVEAVRRVHRSMELWAEEEGCNLLFWKEWNASHPAHRALVAEGYLPLPTLPDHRLRPPGKGWSTGPRRTAERPAGSPTTPIEAFLAALRAPYRRKYRAAEALLRGPGPPWRSGPLELRQTPFLPGHAAAFHAGYDRLMARTAVRLETYPERFFYALADAGLDTRLLHLSHRANGESISALLVADRTVLTFVLTAKDLGHYHAGLYSVLLQCIVLLGVRGGFGEVRLGQTSSWAKGAVGAESWPLDTLVRARRGWMQWILERCGSSLFPEVETPRFHVFHDGGQPRPTGRLPRQLSGAR